MASNDGNEFEKFKKHFKEELKKMKQNSNSFFNSANQEQVEEMQHTGVTEIKKTPNRENDSST